MTRRRMSNAVLTLMIMVVISSCEHNQSNHKPEIISVTAHPSMVATGGTAILSCQASDSDQDELEYEWISSEGSFPEGSAGNSALWEAPQTTGTYTISVIVNDGIASSEGFTEVTVIELAEPGEMIFVPNGTFMMGSDSNLWPEEQPRHHVTLTHDFYLGACEITNEEYRTAVQWAYEQGLVTVSNLYGEPHVVGYGHGLLEMEWPFCEISFIDSLFTLTGVAFGDYTGQSSTIHPVKYVSWYGAACYCDWLSEMEGLPPFYQGEWDQTEEHNPYLSEGYRLPTEAEREYVAQYNDDRRYPWGDTCPNCEYANYHTLGDCVGWTAPVDSYPRGASQLGLMNMGGNLGEWVGDWYGTYSSEPQTDPLGFPNNEHGGRVGRGGSWHGSSEGMLCGHRGESGPQETSDTIGFRVCRTANP